MEFVAKHRKILGVISFIFSLGVSLLLGRSLATFPYVYTGLYYGAAFTFLLCAFLLLGKKDLKKPVKKQFFMAFVLIPGISLIFGIAPLVSILFQASSWHLTEGEVTTVDTASCQALITYEISSESDQTIVSARKRTGGRLADANQPCSRWHDKDEALVYYDPAHKYGGEAYITSSDLLAVKINTTAVPLLASIDVLAVWLFLGAAWYRRPPKPFKDKTVYTRSP